jgi:hypothetical protein
LEASSADLHEVPPVGVDGVEAPAVLRELHPDVLAAHEDGLQRGPLLLHVRPRLQARVHPAQPLLPLGHLLLELGVALHVLARAHGLQLQLVALQRLHHRVVQADGRHARAGVGGEGEREADPGLVDLLERLLDDQLLLRAVHDLAHAVHVLVQLQGQQRTLHRNQDGYQSKHFRTARKALMTRTWLLNLDLRPDALDEATFEISHAVLSKLRWPQGQHIWEFCILQDPQTSFSR